MSIAEMTSNEKLQVLMEIYSSIKDIGYMFIDSNFNIVTSNEFCNNYFNITEPGVHNSLNLFQAINENVVTLINQKIYDTAIIIEYNNKVINIIHQLALNEHTPVEFIYFIVNDGKIKAIMINFIPVYGFIQVSFTLYDNWGYGGRALLGDGVLSAKALSLYYSDRVPVHLPARQAEVAFFLAQGLGIRQIARALKITYGTISNLLKNSLLEKFDIDENNVELLVKKLTKLGYDNAVPQSLTCPLIILTNPICRELIQAQLLSDYAKSLEWRPRQESNL